MGLIKEFRDFAMKGNVVDLAVGVIIGAAFGKVVSSVVEDLVMPPIGKAIGNVDFTNLYIPMSDKITSGMSLADARKVGSVIAYGNFLTVVLNFLIVAAAVFIVVKLMNSAMRKKAAEPAPPPGPTPDQQLLGEIRDLLKARA